MPAVEREEGVVVIGRAEIDTRPPFRSVKEAVMLFGEKVLVGEIYGNKFKEMQTKTREPVSMTKQQHQPPPVGVVSAHELEETKQSLQKAKEESHFMAYYLQSLKQDLEETKRELKQLKRRDSREIFEEQPVDREIEELKFVENSGKVEVTIQTEEEAEEENGSFSRFFEKKRSVKFASPPALARVITTSTEDHKETADTKSKKKMKRKPLFPMFGTLFSKKKGSQEVVSQSPRSLSLQK